MCRPTLFLSIIASTLILSACGTTSSVTSAEKAHSAEQISQSNQSTTSNTGTIPDANIGRIDKRQQDAKITQVKRSVYFDFNDFQIKPPFQSIIEAHGAYLSQHQEKKIKIEGNADDRGGVEYNVGLGQKRAEAVRKALALLGVQDHQMEAVSLGDKYPKHSGQDELSWAENRRTDIVYVDK